MSRRRFENAEWRKRDADGRPRYRIDDQGGYSRRRGDDPRSGRRWRPLCGDRDLGVVPWQVPGPAAPDRLPIAARPDGRRAPRAGAADRGAGTLGVRRAGDAMAGGNQRRALVRQHVPNQHNRVTYAGLFFDLGSVFPVPQVSHTLLGRFTPLGALQTTLLLVG